MSSKLPFLFIFLEMIDDASNYNTSSTALRIKMHEILLMAENAGQHKNKIHHTQAMHLVVQSLLQYDQIGNS
jgi:hypothetical protein